MCKILIQNLGPIKNVEFTLNRVNVITGPQCSGKSTIAKVVSTCSWIEKNVIQKQTFSHVTREFFETSLFCYHQLDKYPQRANVKILYEGDAVFMEYTNETFEIHEGPQFEDKSVGKVAYLPAERNIASLENVESFKLPDVNIRGYLWDWFIIRTKYTSSSPLELFSLGIKYYYSKENGDVLVLEDGNEIPLNAASSGLQSVTPLYACLHYMTSWIYQNKEDKSYEKQKEEETAILRRIIHHISTENGVNLSMDKINEEFIEDLKNLFSKKIDNSHLDNEMIQKSKIAQKVLQIENSLSLPHYSKIILEEPELNLFPQSQIDLTYDILKMIDVSRDTLFVNTHSPYILYALNNCMLGGLLIDKIDDNALLARKNSFINPKDVSVWELRDGEFSSMQDNENKTIQDKEGLIRSNYFDRVMQNVMADFRNLMNYHD